MWWLKYLFYLVILFGKDSLSFKWFYLLQTSTLSLQSFPFLPVLADFSLASCPLLLLPRLLLSFDLMTCFPPNQFTCVFLPCSLPLFLSVSPSLSVSIFVLDPFIPYLLHPLQSLSCSSLWRKGRRKREFFPPAELHQQSAGWVRRRSRPSNLGLWHLKEVWRRLGPEAAHLQERRQVSGKRWAFLLSCFCRCWWRRFGASFTFYSFETWKTNCTMHI